MVIDGSIDIVEGPTAASTVSDGDLDGVVNEIPTSIVDFMEFYLLNYFKAGTGKETHEATLGRALFTKIGCTKCHRANLTIDSDRRVADLETVYDPVNGNPFNSLFATASLFVVPNAGLPGNDANGDGDTSDAGDTPPGLDPAGGSFLVRNFFADLKRHDLGAALHERNFERFQAQVAPGVDPPRMEVDEGDGSDSSFNVQFITEPLWGVGDTAPYGHDGRSGNLDDIILRHGGEAQAARDAFANLGQLRQDLIKDFLRTLVLFGPDDTASNLRPKNEADPLYPQVNHGSIALGAIFTQATSGGIAGE
jgi:hypothetical protein